MVLEAGKFKTKVPADSMSEEDPLPGLLTAIFSLYLHVTWWTAARASSVSLLKRTQMPFTRAPSSWPNHPQRAHLLISSHWGNSYHPTWILGRHKHIARAAMRTRWLSNWVSPVIHGNSKVGLGRHWQESSSYSKKESFWHFPSDPKETAIPVACAACIYLVLSFQPDSQQGFFSSFSTIDFHSFSPDKFSLLQRKYVVLQILAHLYLQSWKLPKVPGPSSLHSASVGISQGREPSCALCCCQRVHGHWLVYFTILIACMCVRMAVIVKALNWAFSENGTEATPRSHWWNF